MNLNPYFPNWNNKLFDLFSYNYCNYNKLQQTLLFCFLFSEFVTWLFNCSLWIQYPSLGTNYYFWQHSALAVEKLS